LRGRGKEVNPARLDWARYEAKPFPYTLRQEPGPGNALGRYKFILADSPAISLHDTPNPGQFDARSLALSSGCIRVEEPSELAAFLFGPQWDAEKFAASLESGQPQKIELPSPVPVFLLYFTTWVNELNELHIRKDIYGRDTRLYELLAQQGAAS